MCCTEDSFGIRNMCTIWTWLLSPNHFFSNCHFRQGMDNQGSKRESDKSQLKIDFSNSQNNKQQQESVFHNKAQGGRMRDLEPQTKGKPCTRVISHLTRLSVKKVSNSAFVSC